MGSDEDLDDAWGVGNAKGPRLPLVLVPTTAGTGSEVTPVSIITVGDEEKRGVSSPVILPDIAMLDAELTLGLPPAITAATGVDAMVHAIEAYASRSANNNPLSQTLAREALRLLGANIETAVIDGGDVAARGGDAAGLDARGAGLRQFAGRGRTCAGLSDRRDLPCAAWPVQRAGAAACAALQRADAAPLYAEIAADAFPRLAERRGRQGRCGAFVEELEALSAGSACSTRLRDVGIGRGAPAEDGGRRDEAAAAAGEQSARGPRGRRTGHLSRRPGDARMGGARGEGPLRLPCSVRATTRWRDNDVPGHLNNVVHY